MIFVRLGCFAIFVFTMLGQALEMWGDVIAKRHHELTGNHVWLTLFALLALCFTSERATDRLVKVITALRRAKFGKTDEYPKPTPRVRRRPKS